MNYLTTFLLVCGVICQSYGINQDNLIIGIIGGACLGFYNSIIYYEHKNNSYKEKNKKI